MTLPIGGYDYRSGRLGYNFGRQHTLSGNLQIEHGTFYNGHKTAFSASQGRFSPVPKFSVEPNLSVNRVSLTQGSFTTTLIGSRVTFTATPLLFVSALVQYNSGSNTVSTNARLRWEYAPGSELFIVYNEQRDTLARSFPNLQHRAFIVKINRLIRF